MMEVLKVTTENWLETVSYHLKNQKHAVGYAIIDEPVVIVFKRGIVDDNQCYELGYKVFEAFNNGGVIVTNKGDVELAYLGELSENWHKKFVEYFLKWLRDKGLNATFEDNDILVDGYKVCGTCITRYTSIAYTGIHIGINTNLEHIKQICTKPMKKIPKGLSEYGITTEEVEEKFLEFCKGGV